MKNIQIVMLVVVLTTLLGFTIPLHTRNLESEAAFIKRHLVDKRLSKVLEQHGAELEKLLQNVHTSARQKHGVWRFSWLPGYYVKYNVARVVHRQILSDVIEQHNLTLIHLPEKYLFHIPGRPYELHSLNYAVIAKEVPSRNCQNRLITLQQAMQLTQAIEKSGHCSTYERNFMLLNDGRISCIDTDGTFDLHKYYKGLIRLLKVDLTARYTKDALDHIFARISSSIALLTGEERTKALHLVSLYLKGQRSTAFFKSLTKEGAQ